MHIFINILSHKLAPSSAKRGTSPYSGPSTHGIKRAGRTIFRQKTSIKQHTPILPLQEEGKFETTHTLAPQEGIGNKPSERWRKEEGREAKGQKAGRQ